MNEKLKKRARDRLTGFAGVVTTAMYHESGRVELLIEGASGTVDGHPRSGESRWYDDERVEILEDDESITAERDAREGAERESAILGAIEQVQLLLDQTICTCTLAKRCPRHDPSRPTMGQQG